MNTVPLYISFYKDKNSITFSGLTKNYGVVMCLIGFWRNFVLCFFIASSYTHGQTTDSSDPTEQMSHWLSLASEHRFKQPDSARYYSQKILNVAKKTGKIEMEAEALRIISISYEAQGHYAEAQDFGLKSLALWRKAGDRAKIANTLNSVGIVYDQQGNFYEALQYYNEAYSIYESLGDDEHLAMMNINLGILFKSQGEYKQVISHYRDAYKIYQRLKLPEEIAFCEANLGSVFYYTQQYDSCIYYSLKAEKALLKQKNLQFTPVAQANAGIGYLAKGHLQEAGNYLQKALRIHRQYGNKKEIAFVLIHLARLYQQQNKETDAYQVLKKAKELALDIGAPQQVMEASRLLADIYAHRENYRGAYNEYVSYSTVKDTLFEQQKTRDITKHQIRYETIRKEQEIALLTQKNTIHELDIRQRNLYLIISGLLITGALLSAWLIYKTRKLKEARLKKDASMQAELLKLEAQNTLQNDRLRISRDLHDNIGANLTFIHTTVGELVSENTHLQDIQNLINDTIAELRRTVWLINKPSVKLDEWLIKLREYYKKIDKVQIETSHLEQQDTLVLSSKQATALFRITQEAVNNSLKHAQAGHILMTLKGNAETIEIGIEDDGKGFERANIRPGFGLDNMQQNVTEIGGSIQIDSIPGKGTSIVVHVSLTRNTQ